MKIYKGTIITCDKHNTVSRYLVTNNSKIEYVGNTLPAKYKHNTIIDLGNKAILPSFVDSHIHFASFALFNAGLNVSKHKTNKDILNAIKAHTTKDKILLSFGTSSHSVLEKRLLTREELDTASPQKPCVIIKYDGHALIANTPLIDMLGEPIKNLRGYDAQSGEMQQEAFFAITDFMTNTIPTLNLIKYMLEAVDAVAKKGIGMFHTVTGIGFPNDLDVTLECLFAKGIQNGTQSRVFFQTMDTGKVIKRKLTRIGGCFATALDGCFGSKDAALIEPYKNSDSKGVLFYSDQEVIDFCKEANRNNLQIELHAIGNAAFRQATTAIDAALMDYPRDNHRHSIIHACLPTEKGLALCQKHNIILPMQSAFIDWELEPSEYANEILGAQRAKKLNPIGDIHSKGITISLGSDGPCTYPDPMLWIHNAVNNPEVAQRVSVLEAIKMATYNGAYNTFDEENMGSLETGKLANIIILESNPLEMDPKQLKSIAVDALILQGKKYKPQSKSILKLLTKSIFAPNKF